MNGLAAKIIDGKAVAAKVKEEVKAACAKLKEERGLIPKLVVIQVGDMGPSTIYVRNKKKACEQVGIESEIWHLPDTITQDELLDKIEKCNHDDSIHGVLVQLPLPAHLDETACTNAISPDKDVDGFHPVNVGRMLAGQETFIPCTPAGIMRLLDEYEVPLDGASCVVIGRSNIVGKPMAVQLLERNATVTVCHSHTRDLPSVTSQADILVSAVGKAHFVTPAFVKPGAVVIDVAMNRDENGRLCGDVEFEKVSETASAITPVPGGVGPMTVAQLMSNCLLAARRRYQL